MRFAQTPDEVIQFFEDGRTWRDIWTDGRKLPGDDADSRWFGYAVGHWEGDTFVVNSNNFDEATWLDQYGSPHSDKMTVEERYRRVDHDHLEMILNITDPMAYVGTWKGDKKIFQLVFVADCHRLGGNGRCGMGGAAVDANTLPVKPGYTAVEVQMPKDDRKRP